ncbi:hypothetical protein B0J18DRAFT_108011 [Chaetomium sp. MPI-SDFR-AT-0129]|nr:hypothetical protein B0J18DRAFT_108011 [Chaetomium sp. MPI-SDFR-AT-0129]
MNPKKNLKSTTGEGTPKGADEIEDACFDKSPFSSAPMVDLQFKQGDYLSVHRALLQRNPKLAVLDPSYHNRWGSTSSQSPPLKHISRSAGHVLVHYLYTDTYHTLKWMGPTTGREETIAKLKTGFEVYATARKYELDGLEELAKEQISLLSKGVDAFTIVDVVNEAYPSSTGKDTWFPTYMEAVIKTAFEDSAAQPKPEIHVSSENEFEDDIPTAKTLLRGALEVYREMVKDASITTDPSQLEDDECERSATTKKNKKDKKKISAVVGEPKVEEPVNRAEPSLDTVDDDWAAISTKRKEKGSVAKEPNIEELPARPKPMPEPEKEEGTATGNTSGGRPFSGGLFSGGSTTRTAFGATNNAAVGDPPGTAGVAFTPTTEKEAYGTQSFRNILFMDAYKRWSSEELRLADYNQGRKISGTANCPR